MRKRELCEEEALYETVRRRCLVMEFVVMSKTLPCAQDLCARIAAIHRGSVSPEEGCFGFPTPSYLGGFSLPTQWERSWATLFARMLQRLCEFESELHGPWLKDEDSFRTLLSQTVPHLLSPLQRGDRPIKPCLVHGNLSADHIGVNMATGEPVVFSPSPLYAHNEYELGMWRRKIGMFTRSYFQEYQKHIPPSDPVEQWDDRIRLYSIHFNLAYVLSTPRVPDVQRQ